MKAGDVCKCISEFSGTHSGELILCKNDIVQIHKVIDKLWLEGEGGGSIGRFPSSIVVKTELPPHSPDAAIYVAFADFHPLQEGDLPFTRGNFVTEIHPVDQDWAYGESYGRKGMFPLNFVWKIDKSLLCETEGVDKPVRMIAKVLTSIKAQLPEELDLYAGDLVTITHIVDDDWYRGECHGQTGIFPSSFVEIIEKNAETSDGGKTSLCEQNYIADPCPPLIPVLGEYNAPSEPSDSVSMATTKEASVEKNDKNIDHSNKTWKEIDINDDDLFNDDYFKVNMPGAYSSSSGAPPKNDEFSDLAFVNSRSDRSETDTGGRDDAALVPLDSLSAEVDKYLSDVNLFEACPVNPDLIDIDFAYTEDNTGINPYGRAVFSFTAQYANELSFRKGNIIHLIRHIDSHWTVGKLGIAKGIFPTSYIDIIVDCPYKAEDVFEKRSESSFSKKAIVCFDFDATAPEDASGKEGDVVLITKFVSENWVEIETVDGQCGLFPLNRLNVLQEDTSQDSTKGAPLSTKRHYAKDDFPIPKKADINEALSKNLSSLDVSLKHSKQPPSRNPTTTTTVFGECIDEAEEPLLSKTVAPDAVEIMPTSAPQLGRPSKEEVTEKLPRPQKLPIVPPRTKLTRQPSTEERIVSPSEDIVVPADENVTPATLKRETSVPQVTSSKSISRDVSFKSSDFPEDVSSSSLLQHSNSMKGNESISSELNPQRPAPPPPLATSESENEEEFYSLPSENEDATSIQEHTGEDGEEETNLGEDTMQRKDTRARKKLNLKRESVNELVTTEHEYVHDLESLIQVVNIGKSRKEAAAVDLKILMGNIDQVVQLSKKFMRELNTVSYNDDEDLMIGPVFTDLADEVCEVYKVYSANNSISVGPLLQKYQEGGNSAVFLNWILTELRQHKVNLLDMQAVLIKPVQRVLKYPLFIDNLVQNTPPTHPDYKNLEDAKKVMLNVAKEINEYTKRLDLVTKYRQSSHHSFGEKIQRVSMRSVAKKGARIRTRISATMGLITKTKDLKFEEEEAKFRSLVKASIAVAEQGHKLLEAVRKRHRAELGIIEAVASALLEARTPQIEAIRDTCRDTCNRILPTFERICLKRVVEPCRALLAMCSAPEHLIQKRYDKLLDFDKAQHKLDKNRDPARTRILEEELKQAQGTYEAMNMQLLMDLPQLNEQGTAILLLAMQSLVSSRMNLEGRVANLYLKLAQMPSFSNLSDEEYLNNFKTEYTKQMNNLKKLTFVAADFAPKSPKFGRRKSSLRMSLTKKDDKKRLSVEKTTEKESIFDRYEASMIYEVKTDHPAEESFELSLRSGTHVGVIKKKDPSGSSRRWYVDDGEQKGFVRKSCLVKYNAPGQPSPKVSSRDQTSSALRGTSATVDVLDQGRASHQQHRLSSSSNETPPVVPEAPPRYEDIFPCKPSHSTREDEYFEKKEENIYEEIDQVACGNRYENIDSEEGEGHIYDTVSTEGAAGGTTKEKEIYFPEPDEEAAQFYYSLYHFGGGDSNQLSLHEGQVVLLLFAQGSEWWFVEDREGRRGYVPAAYLSKYT